MQLFGLGTTENDSQSAIALKRFVDEVGLYSERAGLRPITGRILGCLSPTRPYRLSPVLPLVWAPAEALSVWPPSR